MKKIVLLVLTGYILFVAPLWGQGYYQTHGGAGGSASATWEVDKNLLLPTAADDRKIKYFKTAGVLTYAQGTCVGGTSVSLALQVCDADGVSNCSDLVADAAITCGTAKDFTLAATAIGANKSIRLLTGTVTGVVTEYQFSAGGTQ